MHNGWRFKLFIICIPILAGLHLILTWDAVSDFTIFTHIAIFALTVALAVLALSERVKLQEQLRLEKITEDALRESELKLSASVSKLQQLEVERTARVTDLERMNKLMVNRELKMIELKKENEALKKKSNNIAA